MIYFKKIKQFVIKNKRVLRLLLLILVITFLLYVFQQSRETKTVKIGSCSFSAEISKTATEHYKGLSNRKDIGTKKAMLFIFKDKEDRSFVMRDMLFSLDIIYISEGKVVNLFRNLIPEGNSPTRSYESGVPVEAVLEIKGGLSRPCNIGVGTEVSWQ